MNGLTRQLIFLAVLSAAPILSWNLVFTPQNDRINQINEDIRERQGKIQALDLIVAQVHDLGQAVNEGIQAISRVESKLPTQQDVESILKQTWSIAREHGLTVKSVRSEQPVPAMVYMEQPLAVELEGPFEGFYAFLLDLENLPRITRIFNLKLERIESTSGPSRKTLPPGSVKAEFLLSIYFAASPTENMLHASMKELH
jgi:type IV pilus assembly protein PilO